MNSFNDVATKTVDACTSLDANRIESETHQPRSIQWMATAAVFLLFFLLVWIIQRKADAPLAAFGGFPDESAHYVGGLAMHDYMTTALGKSPFTFLRDYHLYLPFFAIGVWPPLFYFLEGIWMTLFGVQRASA